MATFDWKIDTTKNTDSSNQLTYAFQADNPDGLEVDWGDGNSSTINDSESTDVEISHTYDSGGEYTIKVSGDATRVTCGGRFNHSVESFTSFGKAVTDILTLPSDGITGITNCDNMFGRTSNIPASPTANLNNWDTSSVTNMVSMFYGSSFNQDISNWDTSNVTNMWYMFRDTSAFNQDISNWDTSSVTVMASMFRDASSFNQDIGNWDTSSVEQMWYMFSNSPFNQDIGNWDTSSVTDMSSMFRDASSFDQDLSEWCVPGVESEPTEFGNAGTDPSWGECSYPHIKFQETNNLSDVTIKVYTDSARTTLDATLTANDDGFAPYYAPSGNTTLYYTASKTDYLDTEDSITLGTCTTGTDCENVFTAESFIMQKEANSEKDFELLTENSEESHRGFEIEGTDWSNISCVTYDLSESTESERKIELSVKDDINSEKSIELAGKVEADSEKDFELIGGKSENNQRDIDITGKEDSTSEKDIDITGSLDENSEKHFEIETKGDAENERGFELSIDGGETSDRAFEISGINSTENERDIELHGQKTEDVEKYIELGGVKSKDSEKDINITGSLDENSEKNFEIAGVAISSTDRTIEISGKEGFPVIVNSRVKWYNINSRVKKNKPKIR